MTKPIHPRSHADELKLIRRAIRRLALRRLLQHPDNKGALQALNQILADVQSALGKDTPTTLSANDPRTKDYTRQRDFIEPI